MLDDVLLHVGVKLASGDLPVIVGVGATFHSLHQEVGEHPVLGFLERLSDLVAPCRREDCKALKKSLYLERILVVG